MRRWVYAERAPYIKTETGRLFIPAWWIAEQVGEAVPSRYVQCTVYAREVALGDEETMEAPVESLRQYAKAKGYQITHVVREYASGVSDERTKLRDLLSKKDFDVLLVEHKDRLTRLGFR